MARKKKTKGSQASKTGLGYKIARVRSEKPSLIETKIDGIFDDKLFWSKIYNGFKKFLESPFKSQENKMERTENERKRDDQMINLLHNIWNELKVLNTNIWAVIEQEIEEDKEIENATE